MDSPNSQLASQNILIKRIDSGETDDSPFCSNLVTPTDDQAIPVRTRSHLHDGIEQRIAVAKASLDYFTSGRAGNENGIELDTTPLELDTTKPPLEQLPIVTLTHASESLVTEDGDTAELSTLDSNQTLPSSHPSLAEVVAQARRSSSAFYTLPNTHISIDHKMSDSGSETGGDDTILQEHLTLPESSTQPTSDLLFTVSWSEDLRTVFNDFTMYSLSSLACRVLLFFPWSIAVGATIILSPTNLSSIAFSPSVNYISRPPTPIEVFAHWADYGLQHVTIFAGFVFTILWNFPDAGTFLLGALFAQFCWAWHDFLPEQTTALGEDERQMIYHLARRTWLTGDTVGIQKTNGKYYATDVIHDHGDVVVGSDSDSEESDWSSTRAQWKMSDG